MRIWKRHLYLELFKNIVFILACLFALYILIDFSTFSIRFFKNTSPSVLGLLSYYFHHFVRYLDIFLPLTLMLSMIRVLSDMQAHQEITPLLIAGISRKKIIFEVQKIAVFFAFVCLLNYQVFVPKSLDAIESYRNQYSKKVLSSKKKLGVTSLQDGSTLVYQTKKDAFLFDVFWIVSKDDIWHMKKLAMGKNPIGYYVDHIQKLEDRLFEKTESFAEISFPSMKKLKIEKSKPFIPYENRSISRLFTQLIKKRFSSDEEKANLLTHLHLKLAKPWLSCLIVIALPPYLLSFTRRSRTFFLSIISLALFIGFFTIIDSAAILGENQVISPSLAIWFPFLVIFVYFGRRFFYFD